MAAGAFPRPGTKYGACKGECAHTDCAATRREAASSCPDCGTPIGYDRLFYSRGNGVFVHATCEEAKIRHDRERANNAR